MEHPLVSCTMPTKNRAAYISLALKSFFSQTYPNRELIIVDNGHDNTYELIPQDSRIHYEYVPMEKTVGEMRNICVRNSHGPIICHWDDDDWSDPIRIASQVEYLRHYDLTSYHSMLFFDERDGKAYKWENSKLVYGFGTSLCYKKTCWEKHPFRNCTVGEDFHFFNDVRRDDPSRVHTEDVQQMMVARIHNSQTCTKVLTKFYTQITHLPEKFSVMEVG